MTKPIVSVIVPVLNEACFIEDMVASVLNQKQEKYELELLLIDGGSTDGTREKIIALQAKHCIVKLIDNDKRITPAAFNKGITHATGEYIAILGAHSKYDSNYIDACLEELWANNCAGCSGKVEVAKDEKSLQSILIHCLLTSDFGVSNKSFRTSKEGVGEQCPYPVFKKSIFSEVGFYNEMLSRNQDNDMNYRIRQRGYNLYYTHRVTAYYYPKQTLAELMKYAFVTGRWNAISLRLSPNSMASRHVIPFVFVASIVTCLVASLACIFISPPFAIVFFLLALLIILLHLILGVIATIKCYLRTKVLSAITLPFLFFAFHFCYGWGTTRGLFIRPR